MKWDGGVLPMKFGVLDWVIVGSLLLVALGTVATCARRHECEESTCPSGTQPIMLEDRYCVCAERPRP